MSVLVFLLLTRTFVSLDKLMRNGQRDLLLFPDLRIVQNSLHQTTLAFRFAWHQKKKKPVGKRGGWGRRRVSFYAVSATTGECKTTWGSANTCGVDPFLSVRSAFVTAQAPRTSRGMRLNSRRSSDSCGAIEHRAWDLPRQHATSTGGTSGPLDKLFHKSSTTSLDFKEDSGA